MLNTTANAGVAAIMLEALIQEAFEGYARNVYLEYLALTLNDNSFVENLVIASATSELTLFASKRLKKIVSARALCYYIEIFSRN